MVFKQADLNRLEPGEMLNDTVIEIGFRWSTPNLGNYSAVLTDIIRLILNDLRETNPERYEQTHVFSTFFFRMLEEQGCVWPTPCQG